MAGAAFDAGQAASPLLVDWNNDGLLDVLCGESQGKVLLLLNEGAPSSPLFNAAVPLMDGNQVLTAWFRTSPAVIDANRDGKKDLIVGNSAGGVRYYENHGTDSNPVFDGWVVPQAGSSILGVSSEAKIDSIDWDMDGMNDVLCGDYSGDVWCFRAQGPLLLGDNVISASTGGSIDLHLDAGPANAGRLHLVLGSASGTAPGTPLPGGHATLPLNWDLFTEIGLSLLNTPVFDGFLGTLDAEGKGFARFDTLGPLPGAAGLTIWFAYALDQPWDFVSNGAAVEVVP